MEGYVAVTDPGWWEHLSRSPGPKDANFWRPSARAVRLTLGAPFIFKLKAPANAIGGFGYFAGFAVLPDWFAWETFAEANGVASLEALRARLARIQQGARIVPAEGGQIGCCLVAESVFFERDAWVPAPRDWKIRTQTAARYDLSEGEGLRVWSACLERSHSTPVIMARESARYGAPTLRAPRLGQSIFRVNVLDAYGRACAVTREHSLPVLEAAHIRPYGIGGEHDVANGLALRTDLHRLFDRGYVTIDEKYRFIVGRRLRNDFENGRTYYSLNGTRLMLPAEAQSRPAQAALEWHRTERFLG